MRILIVHNRDIGDYPPVKSLVENLLNNSHEVTIITKDSNGILDIIANEYKKISYRKLATYTGNRIVDIYAMFKNRIYMRRCVAELMKTHEVIWTTTDATVREIGEILLNYKHVMQLMELIEYVPLFPKISIFRFNIKKYARHAWKIVVPEYNRAHIQKVWWDLDKVPQILPNKPYSIELKNYPENIKRIREMMQEEKRKIILYQGGFGEDRNLDVIAEAILKQSDKYCFYIMGKDNYYREKLCERYPNIVYIPFIQSPYHLGITECADIGVLPYIPRKVKGSNNSVLNALYCAPNKIYEYAAFGLPMIGTDVPGLSNFFEKYEIGYSCLELTSKSVLKMLDQIEKNYIKMSANCSRFYQDIDLNKIVSEILECEEER